MPAFRPLPTRPPLPNPALQTIVGAPQQPPTRQPLSNIATAGAPTTNQGRGAVGEFFLGKEYVPTPGAFELEGADALAAQYGDIAGLDQSYAPQIAALAAQMGAVSTGAEAGAGELAVQRQAQGAAAQQDALARSAGGYGGVSAGRNAARNIAQMQANVSGQAKTAALQDQQAARAQQAQLIQGAQQAQLAATGGQTNLAQIGLQAGLTREQLLAQQAIADPGMIGQLISGGSQVAGAAIGGG